MSTAHERSLGWIAKGQKEDREAYQKKSKSASAHLVHSLSGRNLSVVKSAHDRLGDWLEKARRPSVLENHPDMKAYRHALYHGHKNDVAGNKTLSDKHFANANKLASGMKMTTSTRNAENKRARKKATRGPRMGRGDVMVFMNKGDAMSTSRERLLGLIEKARRTKEHTHSVIGETDLDILTPKWTHNTDKSHHETIKRINSDVSSGKIKHDLYHSVHVKEHATGDTHVYKMHPKSKQFKFHETIPGANKSKVKKSSYDSLNDWLEKSRECKAKRKKKLKKDTPPSGGAPALDPAGSSTVANYFRKR